ncbi:hypothetical protein HMPREF3229_01660 [Peptoniphilus harei]|uniref:Uncharacterized protein n=1 Tax=Peptoniphilus harei TaxID=54005 RepID=A0A133PJE0_9FIRM|nr:hypothetical protein HMPREF3229_01660 [Peptoniphilus harei]
MFATSIIFPKTNCQIKCKTYAKKLKSFLLGPAPYGKTKIIKGA